MTTLMEMDEKIFDDLPVCFQHLVSVVVVVVTEDGQLVRANAGFHHLLASPQGQAALPGNIAAFFIQPSFAQLTSTLSEAEQPVYTGLLTIGDAGRRDIHSLTGVVHRQGQHLLVVAEHDINEMARLNTQILDLNEQMAEVQRELLRTNRRLQDSEARFKTMSITDPLTGLANRRRLEEFIQGEMERAHRYGENFAVIMADLDHFKHINDQYGHGVGDEVLCGFARMLREQVRENDLAGRLGGEEFIAVLPRTELNAATILAERLRAATPTVSAHGLKAEVTASFGVTRHQTGDTIHTLLQRVDHALYDAKARGRDRVESIC